MIQLHLNGQIFPAESGELLSKVLQENCRFKMPCGGQGHCGKCKVHAAGQLSLPDSVERRLLTPEELAAGIRLACRTVILGDAVVSWKQEQNSQILLGDPSSAEKQISVGATPLFKKLGVAFDIGTTTLAAQLYDQGGLIAQVGCDNPQASFGADVISRIERSLSGDRHALARAIRDGINQLLARLCETSGCDPTQIDTMVLTGNTAMLYLLTERNPDCLSRAPFDADWLANEWLNAKDLELVCENAKIWLPPCISAFVGADITTALVCVEMLKGKRKRLLVDIGTNGEIALYSNGALLCCATAAGPAFEGAGLSMGMQGENGAICHVTCTTTKGIYQTDVIGNGTAKGICGSGVIDAVSCLLSDGRLDDSGYLAEKTAVISGGVSINQEDIRKVQLAKSAIYAGMETLLKKAGLSMGDLDELLIAGGFGTFLNIENARKIGLIPKEKPARTIVCGNAALKGAAKILCNAEQKNEAISIAKSAKSFNLATDQFFMEKYMDAMYF